MTLLEGDYYKLMDLAKQGIIKSNDLMKLQEEKDHLAHQSYEYKKAYMDGGDKITELKKTIGSYKKSIDSLNGQLDAVVKTVKTLEPEIRKEFMENFKKNVQEIEKAKIESTKPKVQNRDFER